jgi:pimeloyl-ACP methyl ester carboxylesterase
MSTVTSRDGTRIGYERLGQGPPLILIDGALCYRAMGPTLALGRLLASRFSVYVYDRRGRGESGNTLPWSRDREVEDVAALVEAAGGSARLFGISSGAVLALDAACRLPVPRVAVFEPPFMVDQERAPVSADFIPGLQQCLSEGRRSETVKRFMRLVGMPRILVALMPLFPDWRKLIAVAHTVPYDMTLLDGTQSGRALPRERWSGLTQPSLVIDGGKSPRWMRNGVSALAKLLPGSRYQTLPGQTHMVKPAVLARALEPFFAEGAA